LFHVVFFFCGFFSAILVFAHLFLKASVNAAGIAVVAMPLQVGVQELLPIDLLAEQFGFCRVVEFIWFSRVDRAGGRV
jgi:hypothetical protein